MYIYVPFNGTGFYFLQDLLPILALTALSLLLLYLIAIATTTTAAAAVRNRRSQSGLIDDSLNDNDLMDDDNFEPDIGIYLERHSMSTLSLSLTTKKGADANIGCARFQYDLFCRYIMPK
jgi:hypothetical protein